MTVKPIFLNFDEKSDMREVMFRLVPNGLGEPPPFGGDGMICACEGRGL